MEVRDKDDMPFNAMAAVESVEKIVRNKDMLSLRLEPQAHQIHIMYLGMTT